jgi:predicted nuclease of predicted toxin-antitoxin system
LKLYADEGVDRQIVEGLRAAGFDVAYAAETDSATADEFILGKAATEGRLLVTSDKDFGELIYRLGKASNGVMLIRLAGLSAELKARLVVEAFASQSDELPGAFSVLSPGQLRVRNPSRTA